MSKPTRDESLERGERLMTEWGIAGSAELAELEAALGRDSLADVAIACRLGAIPNSATLSVLERLERQSSDKLVRKEAKRSIYRLEQHGVSRSDVSPLVAEPAHPEIFGYIWPIDGRGDQLMWIVRPRADGLAHFMVLLNDPDGLRQADLAVVSRKRFKEMRTETLEKRGIRFVETDWRVCDALARRAFSWSRQNNSPMRGDFPGLRQQVLREFPTTDVDILAAAAIDRSSVASDPTALSESEQVLREPEFRTWVLAPTDLRVFMEEMKTLEDSPIVLSEDQKKQRAEDAVTKAVAAIVEGERGATWSRRLLGMAHFFSADGRRDVALRCAAAGLALESKQNETETIPFFEGLVRGSIGYWFTLARHEAEARARNEPTARA